MEYVVCDYCKVDRTQLIFHVHDTNYGTPGQFSIVQCIQCGLTYLNPRLSAIDLEAAYPEASYDPFRVIHKNDSVATPNRSHRERARRLTVHYGTGRLLDVGCGDGLFLKAMHDQRWICRGVEPNARAVDFARGSLGLNVAKGNIFTIEDENEFDLITLWDVLEHTPSPSEVIHHAHKLLASRGKLELSVPNWDSIERHVFRERWIALDAPRHLYHFAPQSITQMLNVCGFEVESIVAKAPVLSLASNTLRLGGDILMRGGKSKTSIIGYQPVSMPPQPSVSHLTIIRLVHLLMTVPNTGINFMHKGAGLEVVARKATGQ